jgi:hypothetical protein
MVERRITELDGRVHVYWSVQFSTTYGRRIPMSADITTNAPATEEPQAAPEPDPALKELDFLVGRWTMKGHLVGSDEENIVGEVAYEWLPGGFFMRQKLKLDFAGMVGIEVEEFVGHDPETGNLKSLVFSNMSPEPLPYSWHVKDGKMTITVNHGPMDATFQGELSADGDSFAGGWRANPGADPTVNVDYDITGSRVR